MLRFLSIANFALIDQLEVEFGEGLNLFTGETGSGKSILVDAVGLLLGRRAYQEMVREGYDRARVEGVFSVSPNNPVRNQLKEASIPLDGDEVIIRREITRSGSNKVFVNGILNTQSFLAGLAGYLADIHGQHDQQKLLQAPEQLRFLDAYAQDRRLAEKVSGIYGELVAVRRQLSTAQHSEQERLRRIDQLRFQISEIKDLQLTPGLDTELAQERLLLSTAEKRLQASSNSYQLLYEQERSILDGLEQVNRQIEELRELDPNFSQVGDRLQEARFQLEEISFDLRDYSGSIEFNPARLEAVEERLAELQKARRKYGRTVQDILDYQSKIQEELQQLEQQGDQLEDLVQRQESLQADYLKTARELSSQRQLHSEKLSRLVENELSDLAMDSTIFQIQVKSDEGVFSEQGIDTAEFLISPNPGESPKPLARIASGGELSRVILALKSILTLEDYPKTLVFDEVDSGLGGRVASALGAKLARLAEANQVFCVTHLPQIAAFASRHFSVSKSTRAGRTDISVYDLDQEKRVEELARMLAGERITDTALSQAREMLGQSSKFQVPGSK